MTDSLFETRLAVLARLVSQAPAKKLGRTQVMKLFYFLQELQGVPLGYDFRLFTYGPFDPEVLSDLATACGLNTVSETTVIYSRGYGYDITPGPHADRLCRQLETSDPDVAARVDAVLRDFGSFGAAELELRSTILFVDRELHQAGTTDTSAGLSERARQIKPHFSDSTVVDRVTEMAGKGWLSSVAAGPAATTPRA
jgi:uncharacterized protein YwgA